MKKKVMIFLFLIITMVTIGSTTGIGLKSYYELEEKVSNITEFDSNGVRFEYISSKSLEEEKKRIKEVYEKSYKISEEKNSLKLIGEILIEVNLHKGKDKTYVNLTINNEKESNNSLKLENEILKIDNKEIRDKKLFNFYKGKVLEKNKESLLKEVEKNKNNNLQIENGYTWKGMVGKKTVNFGLINYDTGLHLIIGTPVIFTTY
ncbi:MAG: hypothetical protein ACRC30_02090 [Clostridium sp.]